MCPLIPWELVANPLVSVEHILGTTDLFCSGIGENSPDGGSACCKGFNYTQHRSTIHLCAQSGVQTPDLSVGAREGLLHTEPPYCFLQLYWTLFSAFFVFRFSTYDKNDDGRFQRSFSSIFVHSGQPTKRPCHTRHLYHPNNIWCMSSKQKKNIYTFRTD